MPSLLLFFSLILGVATTPQVLYLKKYSSTTVVQGVEGGANLYLASNDDWMYLKNIKITTGVMTYTLDKLLLPNDDSSPASISIAGDLSISTTNNETVTAKLSGFFYVTTALQAKDPSFHVFVVQPTQSVSVTGMKSTVVILNTLLKTFTDGDQPTMTSYVTKINQSPNTAIYFQWGIPSADWKTVTNNTFFQNPIVLKNQTTTVQKFFDNVEPLQIGLNYWYFTVMGPVNMYIENKYVSNHDYKTTATSTTGVIINSFLYLEHVVNFQPDETRGGASGYITSAFMEDGSDLDITLQYSTSSSQKVYIGSSNIGVISWDNKQAYKLTVNTNSTLPGTFYCQYFSFAGDLLPPPQTSTMTPSTISTATSTTTVATTTKGCSVVFAAEFLALVLMASLLS
ncbi:hypothetical protein GCK72_016344 [Caenorhabditis remanei]|uniref:CUB-like domain-containing protein n=1 Tax=Caenorhabditis remanei TaxID=31234 RepID=A0A6A5GXM8_CAERE|nr:hypothetical protein GCK72_016344 [Caenorhabditis remanei]KAF1759877.1 hypothetical protein GCK72_016344 [Caenorhabditis remanei]